MFNEDGGDLYFKSIFDNLPSNDNYTYFKKVTLNDVTELMLICQGNQVLAKDMLRAQDAFDK